MNNVYRKTREEKTRQKKKRNSMVTQKNKKGTEQIDDDDEDQHELSLIEINEEKENCWAARLIRTR